MVRRGDSDAGLHIIVDGEVGVVLEGEELAVLTTGQLLRRDLGAARRAAVADVVARSPLRCLYVADREVEPFLLVESRSSCCGCCRLRRGGCGRPTSCGRDGSWPAAVGQHRAGTHDGLPADRRARDHRRPPLDRPRRHGRADRLVLLPALRLAERLRRDPRQGARRLLPDCARRPTSGCRSSSTSPTRTS